MGSEWRYVWENEKETKKRLLECALKEFSEKGYMKASLRNICKEAGVTTGVLYFFFKDKEDLFACLVGEPLMKLKELIKLHFEEEYKESQKIKKEEVNDSMDYTVSAGFLFQKKIRRLDMVETLKGME